MVIIFVFNALRNKIKDSLKVCTIAEYIISILGALQAEKLTKTSGTCFAGHPVVKISGIFLGKRYPKNRFSEKGLLNNSTIKDHKKCLGP